MEWRLTGRTAFPIKIFQKGKVFRGYSFPMTDSPEGQRLQGIPVITGLAVRGQLWLRPVSKGDRAALNLERGSVTIL